MKFIRREWAWLLGLILAVTVVWVGHYDRLSLANWQVPPATEGDSLLMLSLIKNSAEGHGIPFLSKNVGRLGAPLQANWDDFPLPEEILVFCLGLLSRFLGLAATANLAVLGMHLTAALAFYFCCRYLRYNRRLALAGSLLFAFAYFHLHRSLPHLLVAYSFTIPLGLLSCWLIYGSRSLRWRGRHFWLVLMISLIIGLGNPYNLNLYLQLLLLGLAAHYFIRRRKANLQIGLLCAGVAVAAFFAINLDTLIFQMQNGKNTEGMFRAYFQSELYALKPIELFIPQPNHHIGLLGDIGQKYAGSAWLKGEMFSPYLGLVAIAAGMWMIIEGVGAMLRKRRQPVSAHLLQSAWVLVYSLVGGVNCLLALGGLVLFRSSNRYSIFISALVLLFLASRLSRLARRRSPAWAWVVAGVATAVGLFDQISTPSHIGINTAGSGPAKLMQSDQAFGEMMEKTLPKSSLVFQLPVMEFPEAGWVHNATDYEMLRPFLHTDTLRFTFGNIRGRQLEAWQHEVSKLPAPQMVAALEKYGFAGIYLCRKGYPDGGEALLKQLAEAGRTNLIEDALKEQVCVALNPSATPEKLPTDTLALLTPRAGWVTAERTATGLRRWAAGNAQLDFFNKQKDSTPYAIKCQIGSPTARQVLIICNGREIWRGSLGAGQIAAVDAVVDARQGYNQLVFQTDTPPIPAGPNSPQMIAFAAIDLKITRLSTAKQP